LKSRSERAGAVSLVLAGTNAANVVPRLAAIASAARSEVLGDDAARVALRVFPKVNEGGALAGAIAELAVRENWKIEEFRTEEGRLDEVFRSITLPDTVPHSHAVEVRP